MHLASTFSHATQKPSLRFKALSPGQGKQVGEVTVSWDEPSGFLPFRTLPLFFPLQFPAWGGYSQQPELLSPVI